MTMLSESVSMLKSMIMEIMSIISLVVGTVIQSLVIIIPAAIPFKRLCQGKTSEYKKYNKNEERFGINGSMHFVLNSLVQIID